ncbi:M56 family metallopeptidase [Sphingomonas sp.]|uniref:M56 family metallopeptidase n=1 Tax=Sphingomonas sp. TaxID=28214 RepID=UPI002EDB03B5
MLETLIELGWKSALIAALALLADRTMCGRPAAERVFVLRVAVIALLLLPLAMLLLPSLDLALLPAPEAAAAAAQAPMPAVAGTAAPVAVEGPVDWAGLLYVLGAGAVLLHLAIGVSVLARWTRRGEEAGEPGWAAALARASATLRRPVRLLVSGDIVSPISWGIAPAWILIDSETLKRTGQANAVVAHEMAHIRRFDWPMLIAARIAAALLWFNPLVWLLNRTLARRGETAADEAAVRGIERADYAEALLSFATAPAARGAATGMALWPNALAERITHIALHRHRRGSRMIPTLALVCAAIAAPPLAAARLVPAKPASAVAGARTMQQPPVPARATVPAWRAVTIQGPAQAQPAAAAGTAQASVPVAAPVVSASDQSTALPEATPVPVVQIASVPQPAPQMMRIVGQSGAQVVRTADGVTITAPPPPKPVSAPPGGETPEWAKQAAAEMMQGAAEMRKGARSVELTAELPGVSADERAEIIRQVNQMRAQADELERSARALRGPGG